MNQTYATFGAQVVAHLPRLRRFARTLTRHPPDADDLGQVAMERALVRRDQWRPDSSLLSWVFGIVGNAWIDEVRGRRRREEIFAAEEAMVRTGNESSESDIDRWSIYAALDRLPNEELEAVALVLIEGLTYREAAKVMNVPLVTLTRRLAGGRTALQSMLSESETLPPPLGSC